MEEITSPEFSKSVETEIATEHRLWNESPVSPREISNAWPLYEWIQRLFSPTQLVHRPQKLARVRAALLLGMGFIIQHSVYMLLDMAGVRNNKVSIDIFNLILSIEIFRIMKRRPTDRIGLGMLLVHALIVPVLQVIVGTCDHGVSLSIQVVLTALLATTMFSRLVVIAVLVCQCTTLCILSVLGKLRGDESLWSMLIQLVLVYVACDTTVKMQRDLGRIEAQANATDKFKNLFETTNEALVLLEGTIIREANPAFKDIFGVDPCEALGHSVVEYVPEHEREALEEKLRTAELSKQCVHFQCAITPPNLDHITTIEFAGGNRCVRLDSGVFAYIVWVQDITQKREGEMAVLQSRRIAVENQAKSDFLANVSHEMRTPLHGIFATSDLLLSTYEFDDDVKEQLGTIRAQAKHLQMLIDDTLDLSKIEAGRLVLSNESFDLLDVVEEMASALGQQAISKGVTLSFWVDPRSPCHVIGDDMRLKQILLNLLGNSVKFTDQGHIVLYIVCDQESDHRAVIRILVADNGIGMGPDLMAKLFSKFTQSTARNSKRFGGTGLGLSISRKLVTLMGGSVTVYSAENAGSVFDVHIPMEVSGNGGRKVQSRRRRWMLSPSIPDHCVTCLAMATADCSPSFAFGALATRLEHTAGARLSVQSSGVSPKSLRLSPNSEALEDEFPHCIVEPGSLERANKIRADPPLVGIIGIVCAGQRCADGEETTLTAVEIPAGDPSHVYQRSPAFTTSPVSQAVVIVKSTAVRMLIVEYLGFWGVPAAHYATMEDAQREESCRPFVSCGCDCLACDNGCLCNIVPPSSGRSCGDASCTNLLCSASSRARNDGPLSTPGLSRRKGSRDTSTPRSIRGITPPGQTAHVEPVTVAASHSSASDDTGHSQSQPLSTGSGQSNFSHHFVPFPSADSTPLSVRRKIVIVFTDLLPNIPSPKAEDRDCRWCVVTDERVPIIPMMFATRMGLHAKLVLPLTPRRLRVAVEKMCSFAAESVPPDSASSSVSNTSVVSMTPQTWLSWGNTPQAWLAWGNPRTKPPTSGNEVTGPQPVKYATHVSRRKDVNNGDISTHSMPVATNHEQHMNAARPPPLPVSLEIPPALHVQPEYRMRMSLLPQPLTGDSSATTHTYGSHGSSSTSSFGVLPSSTTAHVKLPQPQVRHRQQ